MTTDSIKRWIVVRVKRLGTWFRWESSSKWVFTQTFDFELSFYRGSSPKEVRHWYPHLLVRSKTKHRQGSRIRVCRRGDYYLQWFPSIIEIKRTVREKMESSLYTLLPSKVDFLRNTSSFLVWWNPNLGSKWCIPMRLQRTKEWKTLTVIGTDMSHSIDSTS